MLLHMTESTGTDEGGGQIMEGLKVLDIPLVAELEAPEGAEPGQRALHCSGPDSLDKRNS